MSAHVYPASQFDVSWPCFRRYSLPLEDFYQNVPGTPDITEWIQADAQSDAVYNCSIHCGREYCGSGPIWGEAAGRGSVVGYPSSELDMNTTSTSNSATATAG